MYHTHVLDRRGTRQELQESRNNPPALIPSSIPIPPCPPLPPIPPMPPFMPLSSSSIPPIPNDLGEWKGAQTHPAQHTAPNKPHPTHCPRKATRWQGVYAQRHGYANGMTSQPHYKHITTTSQPHHNHKGMAQAPVARFSEFLKTQQGLTHMPDRVQGLGFRV